MEKKLDTKNLERDVKKCLMSFMKSPSIGFNSKEAEEYSRVDITKGKNGVKVEVGAEVGYDSLMDLAEKLDKVVSKYDKEAYFDAEEPGIITAYLSEGKDFMRKIIEAKQHKKYKSKSLMQAKKSLEETLGYKDVEVVIGTESAIDTLYVFKYNNKEVGSFLEPKTSKEGILTIYESVKVNEADKRTTYYTFTLSDDKRELRMADLDGNYTLLNKEELEELFNALVKFRREIKG